MASLDELVVLYISNPVKKVGVEASKLHEVEASCSASARGFGFKVPTSGVRHPTYNAKGACGFAGAPA